MFAEGRARRQPMIIPCETRQRCTFDLDVVITIEHMPELNVRKRELIAGQKVLSGEPFLGATEAGLIQ